MRFILYAITSDGGETPVIAGFAVRYPGWGNGGGNRLGGPAGGYLDRMTDDNAAPSPKPSSFGRNGQIAARGVEGTGDDICHEP
jgi:hypothetical protein